ncbi:hypothetical protein ACSSVV_001684 [Marinobacter sp. MBR-105]|jgi:hypothetical protein
MAEPLLSGQALPGREERPKAAARAKGPHDAPEEDGTNACNAGPRENVYLPPSKESFFELNC